VPQATAPLIETNLPSLNPFPLCEQSQCGGFYAARDSAVATLVFIWRGVVDLKLGIILGAFMFLAALLGSPIALFLSAVWLRRIFIAAVLGLALKLLLLVH
jgi:uncharacterized membrane protein YfcA